MKTHLLFVYGSLKRNLHNHYILRAAQFLGEATVRGTLWRFDEHNSFPYATPSQHNTLHGELYAVSELLLERLDRLEGHPTFYRREFVLTSTGEYAWVYFLPRLAEGTPIESGVWEEVDV